MTFELRYLPEAVDDINKLNGSAKPQVLKGIKKVQQNPLPKQRGGYGTPLDNKGTNNLTGFYKIKFKSIGIRTVYALEEKNGIMTIVVVSLRTDYQVYNEAAKRIKKHEL